MAFVQVVVGVVWQRGSVGGFGEAIAGIMDKQNGKSQGFPGNLSGLRGFEWGSQGSMVFV